MGYHGDLEEFMNKVMLGKAHGGGDLSLKG